MNKSEAYNLAQVAVILSPAITPENKLEILRILFEEEKLALFSEKVKEQAVE